MLPPRVLESGRVSAAGELTAHRLGRGRDDRRGWSSSCLPACQPANGRVWHQAGGKPSCPLFSALCCPPRGWRRWGGGREEGWLGFTGSPATWVSRMNGRLSEAICHIHSLIPASFYPLQVKPLLQSDLDIFKKGNTSEKLQANRLRNKEKVFKTKKKEIMEELFFTWTKEAVKTSW